MQVNNLRAAYFTNFDYVRLNFNQFLKRSVSIDFYKTKHLMPTLNLRYFLIYIKYR